MDWLISPYGAEAAAVAMPVWLELWSVFVGAAAGVLVARGRQLDPVGYVGLAIICGLGGGLVRDLILQTGEVYMIDNAYALPIAVVTAVLVFLFPKTFMRAPRFVGWLDIFAVGLYTILGADKAMVLGKNIWVVVLLGTITGVGGGMLRDVFLGDIPRIFRKGNLYAVCAISGAVVYYFMVTSFFIRKPFASVFAIFITMFVRWVSVHYNYELISDETDISDRWRAATSRLRMRAAKRRPQMKVARNINEAMSQETDAVAVVTIEHEIELDEQESSEKN